MIYVGGFLFLFGALAYWMYQKFRAPLYKPGMVATSAERDGFDDDELCAKKTVDGRWFLPNGIELFYFQPRRTDGRPILAIHGGPSIAPETPWKMGDTVSNLHLYHARGCGHSTRPFAEFPGNSMWSGVAILEGTLGLGAQIADVERIRRRLLRDCPTDDGRLDLVGHSFGGFIAALYAAEFPHWVRSLTLLVPAAVLVLPPPSPDEDFFGVVGNKIRERNNPEHTSQWEAFLKRYMDFGSLSGETDESLARRQNEFAVHYARAEGRDDAGDPTKVQANLTGGMACYANFFSMGIQHDYIPICRALLANSTFPVAIVHPGDDMMPESATRRYLELFPEANATFETIPGADHALPAHPRAAEIVNECIARAK